MTMTRLIHGCDILTANSSPSTIDFSPMSLYVILRRPLHPFVSTHCLTAGIDQQEYWRMKENESELFEVPALALSTSPRYYHTRCLGVKQVTLLSTIILCKEKSLVFSVTFHVSMIDRCGLRSILCITLHLCTNWNHVLQRISYW